MPKRGIVHICTGSYGGIQEPAFLIERDGKFYMTLAVQEFDPEHESVRDDPDGRKAIIFKEMRNLMDRGQPLRSMPMPDGMGVSYANTFANTDASSQLGGGGGGEDEDPND